MNYDRRKDQLDIELKKEQIRTEQISQQKQLIDALAEVRMAIGELIVDDTTEHVPGTDQKLTPAFNQNERKILKRRYFNLLSKI